MGYYSDLFMRPKQAVQYAYDHPSMIRAIGFVLLGTLAGILGMFLFAGTIFPDEILTTLLGDVLRWLIGGILLALLGALWKIPLNGESISRALSLFAQLNFYGFFLFIILGLILPIITIPNLLSSTNQYSQGLIGEQEFNEAILASLANATDIPWLAIPFFILAFVLILYMIYTFYLLTLKYLNTTVIKAVFVMLVLWAIQSFIVIMLNGGL